MKIWNDDEVKALFRQVEECKNSNQPLRNAFVVHAKQFKRKPNSVRNYYYHEVDNLSKDRNRCQRLQIELSNHEKSHFEGFDKKTENELFEQIENMCKKGISVRAACQNLSNGDLALMTRLQNKFQNMKRKVEKKDEKVANNIIQFKKQKTLTDAEINSLFVGLAKLIKKNAMEEASDGNILLKKSLSDVKVLSDENVKLKAQNVLLMQENKVLKSRIEKTKALEQHLKGHNLPLDKAKRG